MKKIKDWYSYIGLLFYLLGSLIYSFLQSNSEGIRDSYFFNSFSKAKT